MFTLAGYLGTLRRYRRPLLGLSLAAGVAAGLWAATAPPARTAAAVLRPDDLDAPLTEIHFDSPTTPFGYAVGVPSRLEELTVLFRSETLAARVLAGPQAWADLFGERFDAETGLLRLGWREGPRAWRGAPLRITGHAALRRAMARIEVIPDRKRRTLTLKCTAPTADGARRVLERYLSEAVAELRETASRRARERRDAVRETAMSQGAVEPAVQRRLWRLYAQEVVEDLLAAREEPFGFTVLDAPAQADRRAALPAWARGALTFLATGLAGCVLCLEAAQAGAGT